MAPNVFARFAGFRLPFRRLLSVDALPQQDDLAFVNCLLGFSDSVATQFERETGQARARHLRRTIFVGLVFYNVYSLADVLLRPDLMIISIAFRVAIVTPLCLVLAWAVSRLSAMWREMLVAIGLLVGVAQPILLLYLTRSPLGGYSFIEIPLTLTFGAFLAQLRFPHALFLTLAAAMMTLLCLAARPGISPALTQALVMHIVTNAIFVLYGNYQIERAQRSAAPT